MKFRETSTLLGLISPICRTKWTFTTLSLLCRNEKTYFFNEEAFELMETFNVSKTWIERLSSFKDKIYNKEEMNRKMNYSFPPDRYKTIRTRILEACSIASYHQMTNIPVVNILLSDDAPQFRKLTYQHAYCWIHDGRNYKKLRPVVPYYQEKLKAFLDEYWDYYGKLCEFKIKPDSEVAEQLDAEFDQLFSTKTGYDQLDERISKTKEKKKSLLMVLIVPEIPLHNNAAELAARAKVRKRDVSLQTVTEKGTKANDTFMTIVQTAKKLSVSACAYIYDRVSNKFEMTSLAQQLEKKVHLIENQGFPLNLKRIHIFHRLDDFLFTPTRLSNPVLRRFCTIGNFINSSHDSLKMVPQHTAYVVLPPVT